MERRLGLRRHASPGSTGRCTVIPLGSDVLDLGCGAGVPMTKALAAGRRVTGVDLSARQLELARGNVPEADVHPGGHDDPRPGRRPASMPSSRFYSLTHLPAGRAAGPARRPSIGWLRPGGVFLGVDGRPRRARTRSRPTGSASRCSSGIPAPSGTERSFARAGFEIETAVVEAEPEDRHDALVPLGGRPQAGDGRRRQRTMPAMTTADHPGPRRGASRPDCSRR